MPQPAIPSKPPTGRPARPPSGPGVPLSVWPAVPRPGNCPPATLPVPCPNRITTPAGQQIVTAFTRPGDLVVIPIARTGALAAAATGRRVLALTPSPQLAARAGPGPAGAEVRHGGPGLLLHAASPHTGTAALAVITACATPRCPPPGDDDTGELSAAPADPGVLYAACQRVLRPGGLLAVVTNAARRPGQPGQIIAHARAAGLIYAQHVIAVHAVIHTSRLAVTPAGPPGLRPLASAAAGAHLPIHSDVLLFAAPGGPHRD